MCVFAGSDSQAEQRGRDHSVLTEMMCVTTGSDIPAGQRGRDHSMLTEMMCDNRE